MSPAPEKRLAARKALLLAATVLAGLYAFHPLLLQPVAEAALARIWTGPFRVEGVSIRLDGSLRIARLGLYYPAGSGSPGRGDEPFVDLRSVKVRGAVDPGRFPYLLPEEVRVRQALLRIRKEAHGLWRRRPPSGGTGGPAAAPPPSAPVTFAVLCREAEVETDPPAGVHVEKVSGEGTVSIEPGRRIGLFFEIRHPQWEKGNLRAEILPAEGRSAWTFAFDPLRFDPALRKALPDTMERRWDVFQPSGDARVVVGIEKVRGSPPAVRAEAQWRRAFLRLPPPVPLPLTEVSGAVRASGQRAEVESVTGLFGPAVVSIQKGAFDRAEGSSRVAFEARGLPLDDALRAHLTARLGQGWDFLKPAGAIDLSGAIAQEPGNGAAATYHADLKEVSFEGLSPRVRGLSGRLTLDIPSAGAGDANGSAVLEAVRVGPLPFDQVAVPLRIRPAGGASAVELGWEGQPIRGGCAGGTVEATARAASRPEPRLELFAKGTDLKLGELASRLAREGKRIDGNLEFRLKLLRGPEGLSGEGEIQIRKGDLGAIPTFRGLIERLLGSGDQDKERIRGMRGVFTVHPNKVVFKTLEIYGKNVVLYGTDCTVRFGGEVDLTFHAGVRTPVRHIPLVGDLLEGIWKTVTGVFSGLLSVRIQGDYRDPSYAIEPMRAPVKSIVKTLENLAGMDE